MTDYSELVKALRWCASDETDCEGNCPYSFMTDCLGKIKQDAAAAIEALEAQLPKRGEWKEIEDYDGDFHYQCSVCGEEWYFIDGTPADNNANYCPRCGAKMEVQE